MTLDPNLKVQVDDVNSVIDIRQSAVSSYLDCPRKFYFEYVRGLQPDYPAGPRPWSTADTGTAVHEWLGAHYTGVDPTVAVTDWLMEQWPEGAPEDNQLDLVRIMCEGHLEDLANDGADIGETTIAVEFPVTATVDDVNGWTVNVHGRVDRLIETEDGQHIIDDWKTVGPLGTALTHIQQLGRYALMIRQASNWRADQVRTTQIRKVKRTKDGPFYSRPYVPLNEDAYAAHAKALRNTLEAIVVDVEYASEEDYLFNVTGECSWKCRVEDICVAMQHGDDTETLVDIHYREKGQP